MQYLKKSFRVFPPDSKAYRDNFDAIFGPKVVSVSAADAGIGCDPVQKGSTPTDTPRQLELPFEETADEAAS